ncbi:MAG: UPF0182 family protein, partial [Microbacterium gubbeenense]
PGEEEPTFSMFTSFIPDGGDRQVLMGYLSVDSDAGGEDGAVREDYGKLRMLEISSASTVPAPGQVQNTFDSNQQVAEQLNVLQIGDSTVTPGNLLTLPVGDGLLYMQPVYVQSSRDTSYPLLRKVLVVFGDEVAFEDTLAEALDTLFEGDSGAETGDEDITPTAPEADPEGSGEDPTEGSVEDPSAEPTEEPTDPSGGTYEDALAEAKTALDAKQAALSSGDMVAYAEADADLTQALEKLLELE